MAFQRLLERTKQGPILHLYGHSGDDRTLCGLALEGECADGEKAEPNTLLSAGRVTCPDCIRIVRYCRTIPKKYLEDQP